MSGQRRKSRRLLPVKHHATRRSLLTAVTVPVLIWMVTGRVRDIGWSQGVAYAVLGLFFLPKFMGSLLPTGVLHVTAPAFFLLLVVIGLIPSAGSGGSATVSPSTISMFPQPAAPDAVSSANAASSEFCGCGFRIDRPSEADRNPEIEKAPEWEPFPDHALSAQSACSQCRIWLRKSLVRSCCGLSKNSAGEFCSTIWPWSMKITRLAT